MDIDGDFLRQIAVGDGDGHVGDVANLGRQVTGHGVDAVRQVLPGAGDPRNGGLAAQLAFGADFAGDAGDFGGERIQLIDHRVDRFFELQDFAMDVDGDFLREVAVGDRDGNFGDVADLSGQIARHEVDALGQIFPNTAHATNLRVANEPAF